MRVQDACLYLIIVNEHASMSLCMNMHVFVHVSVYVYVSKERGWGDLSLFHRDPLLPDKLH